MGAEPDRSQSSMTAFRAAYADLKIVKTRGVCQVILELPLEQADAALEILGGVPRPDREVWCGVARLDMKAPAVPAQPEEPAKERTPFHKLPLVKQAGILAKDARFQMWACGIWEEETAAAFIRSTCGVKSRADIFGNSEALMKFMRMYERYMIDTGQWTAPQ
jgi:hypothetical protein